MRYNRQRLSDFTGGSWGKSKNLHLDSGPTYYRIILDTNLNNDQLDQVLVTLNGTAIVDVTGEDLRMLQAYKGRYNPDGTFVIPFADLHARTQDGQKMTALVTQPGDSVVVKVKLAEATAQQNTDGDIPEITPYAVMGPAVKGGRQLLPLLYKETIDAGKVGKVSYKTFERGRRIRRAHLLSGAVTELEIMHNRMKRFDLTKAENEFGLKDDGLVPQAGIYHFDPIQTGFAISDMLNTQGESFEINPTIDTAGDFEILFETVERVANAPA